MALWAATFALWLTPSVGQLARYLGPWGAVGAATATGCVFVILINRQQTPAANAAWTRHVPFALAILLDLAFAVLFPIARSGVLGGGSDRADALDAPLAALLSGHGAYGVATYLGNPPTPLPGALLLALPFHLIGSSAFQNLLWAPLFALFAPKMVGSRRRAANFIATLVLCSPGAMQDLVTGGDYLVNCFYVALAMALVVSAEDQLRSYAAIFFLAVAVSSRAVYAIEAPIMTAWVLQAGGPKRAAAFAASLALCLLLINGPFWLADPARFPLFQSVSKVRYFPSELRLDLVLPAVSLLIASAAFRVRLTLPRLFGLSALALAPIFLPILIFRLFVEGPSEAVLMSASFCLPLTVFGGLWLFSGEATKAKAERFNGGLTGGELSTESLS
jgi:hypothetical protein